MNDYSIHPSIKVLEIDKGKKIYIPKEIKLSLKDRSIELENLKLLFEDTGFRYIESQASDSHIDFSIEDTKWLYEILVEERVIIKAKTAYGLFKGLQTILKYLIKYNFLYAGTMKDVASNQEVGFHLDCGRKYFSSEWIKKLIRRLSWMNFTHLELHFSENLGLRLENRNHKNLLSNHYISLDEVSNIMEYAKSYNIEIVPSLDSPGHLKHILKKLPHFALEGSDLEALDISNSEAIEFLMGFYDDYLDIFKMQTVINLGADEFIDFETFDNYPQLERYAKEVLKIENGSGYDTYIHTINTMSEYLENKGFKVRVWNDGLLRTNQRSNVELNKSLEICYWTKYNKYMAPLSEFENRNYSLVNYHAENFYYTLHPEGGIKIIDPHKWYGKWSVNEFSFNQMSQNPENILGAYYSLWCDAPTLQTEDEIMKCLELPLMAFSQSVWSGHGNINLNELIEGGVIGAYL